MDRSFERLYRRHRSELVRLVLPEAGSREDAEDAVQTAFLDAYRALRAGTVPRNARAWLITIARNASRRRFRLRRGRPEPAPLDETAIAAVEDPWEVHEIRDALERLHEGQRRVLLLREVAGLSYAEIADELDTSVTAVQMHLFRARRAFRDALTREPAQWRFRGLIPVPPWLGQLVSGGERLAPAARAAGAAAAAVVISTGLVVGDTPAPGAADLRPSVDVPSLPTRGAKVAPSRPEARTRTPAPQKVEADVVAPPRAPARAADGQDTFAPGALPELQPRERTKAGDAPAPAAEAPPRAQATGTEPAATLPSLSAPPPAPLPAELPPIPAVEPPPIPTLPALPEPPALPQPPG